MRRGPVRVELGAGQVPAAVPSGEEVVLGRIELHKLWNAGKKADPALAWWSENSKCAYQEAFRDLDRALKDFVKSRKGERKGKRLGFPKFKKRGKCRDSFRLTGVMRCEGNTVALPRLGTVRTHESTEKLARKIGDGRPGSCRRPFPVPPSAGSCRSPSRLRGTFRIGTPGPVLRSGSTSASRRCSPGLTTGRVIAVAGPRPLRTSLRKLRRASRAHSRKVKGSANRRKSAARLARIHARVANVRADALHKATSDLAARYETVVAEDLNVTGMIRNRKPRPRGLRPGIRRGPADARYKTRGTADAGRRGPLVSPGPRRLELRGGESQADPDRAGLPLRDFGQVKTGT